MSSPLSGTAVEGPRLARPDDRDAILETANLVMRANFRLARRDDDSTLMTASAISANSYNILGSKFGTLSAENDARARAVREISDEIKSRIGIYLSRLR